MAWIDTTGLDNAEVLAALFAAAREGKFATGYEPGRITVQEARERLAAQPGVDYLHGRPIKIEQFEETGFEGVFYDSANGAGTAQKVVDKLRASKA